MSAQMHTDMHCTGTDEIMNDDDEEEKSGSEKPPSTVHGNRKWMAGVCIHPRA